MDDLDRYFANQPAYLTDDTSHLRREIAYMRIKDAIQHADVEPGQPLSETRLSKLLGISRTPVREALRRLAQEGLVEVIPGRAVTVAFHSMQDVMDVVHIRYLLEPEMARLTVDAITNDDLTCLVEAMEKMEAAIENSDLMVWSKADTDFHEILSAACPNKLLGELIVQMRNRVHHLANVDSHTNPARLAACTVEHREIVDAFVDGDAERASQVTRAHIEKLRQSLFKRLSYG